MVILRFSAWKIQCVYFCFEEVSYWVYKMFCFQPEGWCFLTLFLGYTCICLVAIIFLTGDYTFKKWLPPFSFQWSIVSQRFVLLKQANAKCHWKLNPLVWNLMLRFEIWGSLSHILYNPSDCSFEISSCFFLYFLLTWLSYLYFNFFTTTRLIF